MSDWRAGVYHAGELEGHLDKDTQDAVLFRDGFHCLRCGTNMDLTIHHIVPRAEGGHDGPSNLMTLCRKCHDYIECLPLHTKEQIINEPAKKDKRAKRKKLARNYDWHTWVYGGYRNPYLFRD